MLDHILSAVEPLIVEAVALLIAAMVARLVQVGTRYLGAETTIRLRAVLDEALERGALQASTSDPEKMAEQIVAYVRQHIPETLARLKATEEGLRARARLAAGASHPAT